MTHYIEPDKRIQFVKAREDFRSLEQRSKSKAEARKLDGKEVAAFYRDLITESSEQQSEATTSANVILAETVIKKKPKIKKKISVKANSEPLTDRDIRLWFKAAAENDLKKVKELLQRGINVDITDFWGSTALICAAAANAEDVVEFLMEHGCNWMIKNQAGFTSTDLARRKHYYEIARYIESYNLPSSTEEPETGSTSTARIFCEQCKDSFTDPETHHCSIVHIVNTSEAPRPGYAYGIPSSNVGYQMLKETGWSEGRGLGKDGRKYPLKTTLKRDRKGLGLDKLRPKVTHFEAGDLDAIKAVPKIGKRSYRKALAEQKKRDKAIEDRVRRAVSDFDDLPG